MTEFVCGVKEQNSDYLSACKNLGEYQGTGYCVLHYPGEERNKEVFLEIRESKLDQKDYDFSGTVFSEGTSDFTQAVFDANASFAGATFLGRADFLAAQFSGWDTSFRGAQFSGEWASFINAQFIGESTDFIEAQFSVENTGFYGAQFRGKRASFIRAHFNGENTNFSEAQFIGESTDFIEAQFSAEKTHFSGTEFDAMGTEFREAQFSGESTDFSGAQFSGEWTHFSEAQFSAEKTYFSGTEFGSEVNFQEATFKAKVRFDGAQFKNGADFHKSTFNGEAHFPKTAFTKGARFDAVTFDGEAHFPDVQFEKMMRFDGATFKEKVAFYDLKTGTDTTLDFRKTTIEKPERVYFHNTNLHPSWFVDVDSRKFDFTDVKWYGLSHEIVPLKKRIRVATDALSLTERAKEVTDRLKMRELKPAWEALNKMGLKHAWYEFRATALVKEIEVLEARALNSPHTLLAQACRRLSANAEENREYPSANEFHYWSMEALRKESWRSLGLIGTLYWALSGYGVRAGRALGVLLTIAVVFAVLYMTVGHYSLRVLPIVGFWQAVEDAGRALMYSLGVMARLRPEPIPKAMGLFQILVTVEGILGPLQIALLALAVRRKVMR